MGYCVVSYWYMLTRDIDIAVRLSRRPRPTGVVSKRLNIIIYFLHRVVAQSL